MRNYHELFCSIPILSRPWTIAIDIIKLCFQPLLKRVVAGNLASVSPSLSTPRHTPKLPLFPSIQRHDSVMASTTGLSGVGLGILKNQLPLNHHR